MDIINEIKQSLNKLNMEGYIVGGFLRDACLKKKSTDLDIAVYGDIENLINILEIKGLKFFLLNSSEKIYRAIFEDSIVDITIVRGKNIYEDLKKRDFSINRLAMSLKDDKIIDPENCMKDIKNKVLKCSSEFIIKEDPIRIFRGIRFILKYDLKIDEATKTYFNKYAGSLSNCKKERKFVEFMKVLEEDRNGMCFSIMDNMGILEDIIPYSKENKTIGKCKYHVEDALTHMIITYGTFRSLLKGEIRLSINQEGLYSENISFFSLKHYMALAAFIHDIGKYVSCNNKGYKVTFCDHQIKGRAIAEKFIEDYGFPKKAVNFISNLVSAHMEPLFIFKNKDEVKYYIKFFKSQGELTPYIIILSFCDVYATRLYHDPDYEIDLYRSFIEKLYSEYLRYKNIIKNPVISAEDLIEEKQLQGSEIKEAVDLINEKTFLGKIINRYEALNLIKGSKNNE